MLFYLNTNIRVKHTKDKITIQSNDGSDKYLYLRLRLPAQRRIHRLHGCKLVHNNNQNREIVVKTNKHFSQIQLR
jgi:hypothetical protein